MGRRAISTGQRRPISAKPSKYAVSPQWKTDRPAGGKHEAAEAPVLVVQHPRAPMVAGGQRDRQAAALEVAPVIEFVDTLEAEVVHQVAHAEGDDDGLVRGDGLERAAVEMVEVRVGDEHEVDHREFVQVDAGRLEPFDPLEPERPVRVDEDVQTRHLHEKRGVPDPGDPDLVRPSAGNKGVALVLASRGESSEGRRTSVRKLRLCQPFSSFTPTRVAGLAALAKVVMAGLVAVRSPRGSEQARRPARGDGCVATGGGDLFTAFPELAGHGRKR